MARSPPVGGVLLEECIACLSGGGVLDEGERQGFQASDDGRDAYAVFLEVLYRLVSENVSRDSAEEKRGYAEPGRGDGTFVG